MRREGVASAATEPGPEDDGGLGDIAGMLRRTGGYVDPDPRLVRASVPAPFRACVVW